jgi:hypothetical protein
MVYYSMNSHTFLKNEKAISKGKKYTALIQNNESGKIKKINYGSSINQQYEDKTGLGMYTHKNHKDKDKRENYKKRHNVYIKQGFFSPGYFSMKYLW